jgi:hypothetical protein
MGFVISFFVNSRWTILTATTLYGRIRVIRKHPPEFAVTIPGDLALTFVGRPLKIR